MKKAVVLIIICFFFWGCNPVSQLDCNLFNNTSSDNREIIDYKTVKENLIQQTVESMSLKSKVAQMLLISVDGNCLSNSISLYTGEYSPGGFLLFKFNVDSSEYKKIKSFNDLLKNTYTSINQIAPYIAIDHEGGDVNRLKKVLPGLPSQEYIASCFSLSDAKSMYYYHSKMLEKLGININLAPITEIKTDENHEFLVNRSFGDSKKVFEYVNAALWGIERTSVLPVQKHFPGNTNEDTHTGRAVINSNMDVIRDLYIAPFKDVRNINNSAVMMSHTVLNAVDSNPSCISKETVKLFKDSTGFSGLLFTDDLTMDALSKSSFPLKKAMVAAIDAGVDVIMLSITNYIRIVDSIISEIEGNEELVKKIDMAVKKIINWKIDSGLIGIDLFSEVPSLSFDIKYECSEGEEQSFDAYHDMAEAILQRYR